MSQNAKNLVGTLLIALGLFSVGGFLLPAYQGVTSRIAAIQQRQDIVKERQVLISKVGKAYADYQRRVSDVRKFTSVVPVKKSTAELISELQTIAAQTGIQLSGLSLQEQQASAEQDGVYQIMTLNVDLVGGYPSLISFLDAMERNLRLLDVASVDAAAGEGGGSLLRFKIHATAYFLR